MSTAPGSTQPSSSPPPWSGLPDDLLGMVRLRLACPRDRVRVAAVCKGWRAAASRLPPPARPLLLVSPSRRINGIKLLCGPDDCFVVRVPDKAEDKWFVGSHDGGWVAAVDYHTLAIFNFFSGANVVLAPVCSRNLLSIRPSSLRKIIFSEAPTAGSCILAAILGTWSHVALRKVGGHEGGWTAKNMQGKKVRDIAFCSDQLYGLMDSDEQLVRFEIGMNEDGTPVITSSHSLAIQRRHGPTYENDSAHIFELHGKPSMAVRTRWLPNHDTFFKIFTLVEADDVKPYKYKWAEVVDFHEHAIFLGPNWSKAVHVPVGRHRGLERNHIYYGAHTSCPINGIPADTMYSMTMYYAEHVYCRKDRNVGDGLERIGYHLTGSINSHMWLCPSNL
ncbi:hypothetical protein ZWY2020_055749 [Hordeum vulgare]|nr:hypothetical protein ZWY2020_055749 [Hordeum vulgare]